MKMTIGMTKTTEARVNEVVNDAIRTIEANIKFNSKYIRRDTKLGLRRIAKLIKELNV